MQELTLSRGFQSSVSTYLNFGVGNEEIIESVKVLWPDGKTEQLNNVEVNTTIEFDIKNSGIEALDDEKLNLYFENEEIVNHKHKENIYDDYAKEVLLPHENSKLGPGIATGDINGDGLEDFVIGGAKDQSTAFYFQNSNGSFSQRSFYFSSSHSKYEDMDMILNDFDSDGDLDLYIVSGGNEFEPNSPILKDRIYVNDGRGYFS